jgi:galactonate dehydratase
VKITTAETFRVTPRWLFCKITTGEGLEGWGEPVVEGRAGTLEAAVDELSDYLIGSDPLRIEDTWQVLTKGGFYRGGPVLSSAVAGIDQALWDIAGKAYGVPVYPMLGGPVREKMRIYGWIAGDSPGELAEQARRQIETGLTAIKMAGSALERTKGSEGRGDNDTRVAGRRTPLRLTNALRPGVDE